MKTKILYTFLDCATEKNKLQLRQVVQIFIVGINKGIIITTNIGHKKKISFITKILKKLFYIILKFVTSLDFREFLHHIFVSYNAEKILYTTDV